MKLTHIFWALFVLAIILLIPGYFYRPNSKLMGGPDLVLFYLIVWGLISIITPILILLRKFNIMGHEIGFGLTFLTISNLTLGAYGIYLYFSHELVNVNQLISLLFFLNLVWAGLLIVSAIADAGKKSSNQ